MPPQVSVSLAQFRGMQQIRGEHLVRPDGTITLGTYGSVYVAGMTLGQIKWVVEQHLSEYLQDPQVAVDVFAYNSKVYYVIFDGAGYGMQVFRLPITGNETVLDAVSRVNGLAAVASKRRLWLARPVTGELRAQPDHADRLERHHPGRVDRDELPDLSRRPHLCRFQLAHPDQQLAFSAPEPGQSGAGHVVPGHQHRARHPVVPAGDWGEGSPGSSVDNDGGAGAGIFAGPGFFSKTHHSPRDGQASREPRERSEPGVFDTLRVRPLTGARLGRCNVKIGTNQLDSFADACITSREGSNFLNQFHGTKETDMKRWLLTMAILGGWAGLGC